MVGVLVVLGLAVILALTSFVIRKWFPKWKKFEPLVLVFELLSYIALAIG